MPEKRYFWFKVKEDFFDSDKISWLKEQPGGREAVLIFFELCCRTLKNNGEISRKIGEKIIPHNEETLSILLRLNRKTVKKSMQLLCSSGLISEAADGLLRINNLEDMTGSESAVTARTRKFRAKEKELKPFPGNINGTQMKQNGNTDIDIELELEKEPDIEEEETKKKNGRSPCGYMDNSKNDVFTFWDRNIQPLREYTKDELQELLKEYGASVVMLAMKRAMDNGARSLSYVKAAAAGIASGEAKKKKGNVLTMECPWPGWEENNAN